MIELEDENALYQWDSGRRVVLTGDDAKATQVHFAQYCSVAKALVVEVKDEDGKKFADIPNVYLTEHKSICVWTWDADQTISGVRFRVKPRARPSDYIYTPTEVLNYESLKQWLLDQFQQFEVQIATDYNTLANKPRINGVELVDDKSFNELGIETATDKEIDDLFA